MNLGPREQLYLVVAAGRDLGSGSGMVLGRDPPLKPVLLLQSAAAAVRHLKEGSL